MNRPLCIALCALLLAAAMLCGGCSDELSQTEKYTLPTLAPLEEYETLTVLEPPTVDPAAYEQYPEEPPTEEEIENQNQPADWLAARDALLTLLYTDVDSVSVAHCHLLSNQDTMNYFGWVFQEEPWFLRLCSDGSLQLESDGTYITRMSRNSPDKAKEQWMYYDCLDTMAELLYGLREEDSPLSMTEKLLILHDRLAAWVRYDQDNCETDTVPPSAFSAYGPLALRSGVCNGYARAMGWMMGTLGADFGYETSTNMKHGWNRVTLDGTTYFLDVTHDDPIYSPPGLLMHDNFLVSSAKYNANHKDITPDWDMTLTDTRFEDAFWTRSVSQIVYVNGFFFFIDKDTGDLIGRSLSGTETPILNTQQAFLDYGYLYLAASRMTAVGEWILYTQPRSVCAYSSRTGEVRTVYTAPDSLFYSDKEVLVGLDRIGGVVRVYPRDNPNGFATADLAHCGEFTCCDHENAFPFTASDGTEKRFCPDCCWFI